MIRSVRFGTAAGRTIDQKRVENPIYYKKIFRLTKKKVDMYANMEYYSRQEG